MFEQNYVAELFVYDVSPWHHKFSDKQNHSFITIKRLNKIFLKKYYNTGEHLIDYHSGLADSSNSSNSKVIDKLIIMGHFNADPTNGRFLKLLGSLLSDPCFDFMEVFKLAVC